MKNKDEMYAYISINNFKISVEELEKIVGFKGTVVHRKGDLIGRTKIKCKENQWKYRVDASADMDLNKIITKIFKKFRDEKTLRKISKIGRPEMVCVFWSYDRMPNVSISEKNIKLMGIAGVSFWVDYYLSGCEEKHV